jgi:hypothetical protein
MGISGDGSRNIWRDRRRLRESKIDREEVGGEGITWVSLKSYKVQ